jgi:hypothetical protein
MNPPARKTDAPDDASIPLLTERLTLPPLELDTSLPLELPQEAGARVPVPLALDTSVARPTPAPAPAPPRPAAPLPLDTSLPPAARTAPPAARTAPPAPAPATPPRPAPAAPATPPRPAPVAAAASVAAEASGPGPTTSSHWTRIELELRSSILQAIADALPQQIDSIVRNRMSDAIDRMVAQLSAETRLAVAASLRDIVDHAVRTELARLRGQKR